MPDQAGPSANQVARRLFILRAIHICGYIIPPADILAEWRFCKSETEYREILEGCQEGLVKHWSHIDRAPLRAELGPDEEKLIATPVDQVTPRHLTDAFWRIESIQALMWCLGQIEAMPLYDRRADDVILREPKFWTSWSFLDEARLRPQAEIEAARDEAELWHWRSRTRELIESGADPWNDPTSKERPADRLDGIVRLVAQKLAGEVPPKPTIDEDMPAMGKAYRDLTDDEWADVRSITIERHLALNWVCGYAPNNYWELTPTGT